MASRLSKWFFWGYWITLIIMVFIAVIGSQAVTRSDDLRVYLMASRVAPYNTNWVSVIRDREKPETTALMVNVPGTNDKAHMRYVEYMTADLSGMDREELKRFIQSDTEASVANEPVHGKLLDVDPKMAKLLFYDTKGDMLLLGLTLFSLPEVIFLIATTIVTLLRFVVKGRGRRALVVFTYWTKVSYFVSFFCMCAALWAMSFPVYRPAITFLSSIFK